MVEVSSAVDRRPRCSVIMPAFRSGAYIEEAAASVLNQTVADLELIIVDDGCPDGSYSRIAQLGDPRVVIHRQDNRGPTHARNAGLALAHGTAILFLDADDRLHRDAVERLWDALAANPVATVAYGRAARVNADGQVSGLWHRPLSVPEPSGDVLRALLHHNFIRCPGAALIRASCFQRTHPLDPSAFPGADWELWCRLAALGPFVSVRGAPVVDYRTHSASLTLKIADDPSINMRSVALVFSNPAIVRRISAQQVSVLYRKREASIYAWLATECMRAGDMTRAEKLFRASLERSPWSPRVLILLLFARARIRPPWF